MEVEEIQAQTCKFPRVANGRRDPDKVSTSTQDKHNHNNNNHYPHQHNTDDNKQDRELKMVPSGNSSAGGANDDLAGNINNRFRGWHHSSRIIRVSRSSGGKDRHSKVWTSKGLRDRRVRLSVATAIQFYDLQDRLGYDQPSKAVEWLIKAAADSIAELPALNSPFPETPRQPSDEKHTSGDTEQGQLDSAEVELDVDGGLQQQQNQHLSLSKSACSSTSETSKGSGLSLSRSDIRESRVKRRERARERTAKEKEKEKENESRIAQNVNPISQNASFTELLTGGGISSMVSNHHANSPTQHFPVTEANFFQKQAAARQWPTAPMDYFGSGFPGQIQLGNSVTQPMTFNGAGDNNHQELQHFPFIPDHNIMAAAAATSQPSAAGGSDYINFSISSSGLAGYHNNGNNRGTLQSNSSSPSFMPHLQRFPPIDGSSNIPFFIGTAAPPAAPPMENHHHHHHQHHQFPSGFDGRLQLYYTDRHPSDHKGKGKN